jgi:tRNA1Val (adenine37-N6)-methyltransferase
VSLSQWKDRIRVVEADFLKWEAGRVYDLITCNPPFFRDSLKSPDSGRSKARHDDILPLDILIGKSSQLLNPVGSIALILPVERLREAARLSVQHHLNLNRILRIKGTPESAVKRVLIQLGKKYLPVEMGEISVNADENGVYSTDYKEITRDFYL